jgi:hypothetical protein
MRQGTPRSPAGTHWYALAFKFESTYIAAERDSRRASTFFDVVADR